MTSTLADDLAGVLARLDREAIRATYQRQNEFVHLPGCLPPSLIGAMVGQERTVLPLMATRNATGVRLVRGSGHFETERAIAAGRRVAEEVNRGRIRSGL